MHAVLLEVEDQVRLFPVAEVLLFHHAQGLTRGCLSWADELRAAGHVVHAPDLDDGKTLTQLAEGVGYAEEVGFETIIECGRLAADSLPNGIVHAGSGDRHLFADNSLPDHVENAATPLKQRVLSFVDNIE